MANRGAIGLGALLLAGCFEDPVTGTDSDESGGDTETDTGDDELNVGGTWTGAWLFEGQSGGVTLQLFHTGGPEVTGTVTFAPVEWLTCISQANVDGTLEDDQLTGISTSDDDEFTFIVTVAGDQMQGSYEITAGDCGLGLTGDIGLMRMP